MTAEIQALCSLLVELKKCPQGTCRSVSGLVLGRRIVVDMQGVNPICFEAIRMALAMHKFLNLGAVESNHQDLNVSRRDAADTSSLTERFWKMFS